MGLIPMRTLEILLGVMAACVMAAGADPAGLVRHEFIFETAPFPECHASTIAESSGGLVAAWFGGTREGRADVGIWLARHLQGRWTPPVEVAHGVQYAKADGTLVRHPCWNPALYQVSGGPLLLFYKVGPSPREWWGMIMRSTDGGQSWSEPIRLPEGISGPVKNKPVRLDGVLLCGSSTEDQGWRVHFESTADGGRTWQRTDAVNDGRTIAAIQPSILFHPGGRLQALGRSRQGKLWESWSADQGRTWSALALTELPNPNSGTDAATLRDGRQVLVYNHTARGRSPLNVAVSSDGKEWKAALALETEPGEYSYPAVIQTGDGMVHVTYTWKRQRIRHAVIDADRLDLRRIAGGQWPSLP
ncbi:MAG: exo-alpha-sialidase [Verrucomicrobia bacterium]|nr:exo-alpha-sialidase [Verrucomicrobiota bacterium]